MSVRIEKDGPVWTIIHSRYEARNAMDPESATDLFEAFKAFQQTGFVKSSCHFGAELACPCQLS